MVLKCFMESIGLMGEEYYFTTYYIKLLLFQFLKLTFGLFLATEDRKIIA